MKKVFVLLIIIFSLLGINCGNPVKKQPSPKEIAKGESAMGVNKKINHIDGDELSSIKPSIKEKKLAPRIDDGISSKSYQVIKITDYRSRIPQYVDRKNYYDRRRFIKQSDIIKAIKGQIERIRKVNHPDYIHSSKYDLMGAMLREPEYIYHLSKYDPIKLKVALEYFETAKKPYIFTGHYGTQVYFAHPERNYKKNNLVITDFVVNHLTSSWSTYALILKVIPLGQIGTAKYSFVVNGETIDFRTIAEKKIWSFSDKYWEYADIFSTNNGKNKAPLLILISHPMDSYLDNGFYLVIPK
jgi:hypothetical protein